MSNHELKSVAALNRQQLAPSFVATPRIGLIEKNKRIPASYRLHIWHVGIRMLAALASGIRRLDSSSLSVTVVAVAPGQFALSITSRDDPVDQG